MAEYVEREAALRVCRDFYDWNSHKEIRSLPAADVAPVVHGRWEVRGQEVFCTNCDSESGHNAFGASVFSNYCPNCGAHMRDGDKDG